jgi:non-ribosomal peptide synthetase component E (peptide arylation enzyme)
MFSRYGKPLALHSTDTYLFRRYLQSDQTEKAFDSEGFYKSGDCAEKLEDCYIIHGRASIDGT